MKPPTNSIRHLNALVSGVAGLFYYLLLLGSFHFSSLPNSIASVWLPSAVAAVVLARIHHRRRFAIAVAIFCIEFAACLTMGNGMLKSFCLTTADFCEIIMATGLILFLKGKGDFLDGIGGFIRNIAPATLLAPLVGAGIITAAGHLFGFPQPSQPGTRWYVAHALGMLSALPLGLALTKRRLKELSKKHILLQLAGMLSLLFVITTVARQHSFPPVLLMNMALVLAALLLPTLVSFFLNLIAIVSTDILTSTGVVLQTLAFQPGFDPARHIGIALVLIPAMVVAALMESIRNDKRELTEATRRARLSEEAKSMFLAAMSHEIRSPLNSIIGFANLLWDSSPMEKSRELIRPILTGGEVLLSVINDILDYSKIEAGHINLEAAPFSPSSVLWQVEELYAQRIRDKDVAFNVEIGSEVPSVLIGDANRMRQVWINLVSNALKFTSKGSIEIYLHAITAEDATCLLHFEIRDTGIGIPEDKFLHIFERFEQIDSSTARKFGGTGLGLAISKSLTEAMKGRLWVESKLGAGSTFHMEIPLRLSPSDTAIPSGNRNAVLEEKFRIPKLSDEAQRLRILVVDDNESNAKLVTLLLRRMGCSEMVTAQDGQAAVNMLQQEYFDVVLMDCQMPIMDGFEATLQIRRMEKSRLPPHHTQVIALTAAVLVDDQRKASESGMDDFVSKPIRQHALAFALEKARKRIQAADANPS